MWSRAPKLSSLPPANEAIMQSLAYAHLKVAIWQIALESDLHVLDPSMNNECS
jgi:hypothetical protein